jgi:hypothetical protein
MVSARPELGVLRLRAARQAFPVWGVIGVWTAAATPAAGQAADMMAAAFAGAGVVWEGLKPVR